MWLQEPFLDGRAAITRSIKEKGLLKVARAIIAGVLACVVMQHVAALAGHVLHCPGTKRTYIDEFHFASSQQLVSSLLMPGQQEQPPPSEVTA
jgi:hypothetical protein